MLRLIAIVAAAAALPAAALGAETDRTHFPVTARPPAAVGVTTSAPPFSAAVQAGKTLYISGSTDHDPATGKPADTPERGATLVLDAMKKAVETAGMTMDDLVWVQVFCTDLSYFPRFNAVYQTYFKGPLPARAFLGVDHLLGGAHFEVMAVAVRRDR